MDIIDTRVVDNVVSSGKSYSAALQLSGGYIATARVVNATVVARQVREGPAVPRICFSGDELSS